MQVTISKLILIMAFAAPVVTAEESLVSLPEQTMIPPHIKAAAEQAVAESRQSSDSMIPRVTNIMNQVKSPEWQARKNAMLSDIRAAKGLTDDGGQDEKSSVPGQDRLVLFISSSVPLVTLRNYARDVEKTGGVMVLRGMIGGMTHVQPTLKWIASILRHDAGCDAPDCAMRPVDVIVDPQLFRDHDIKAVPALTYAKGLHLQSYCELGEEAKPRTGLAVVYGDSSMYGLIEELNRLSPDPAYSAYLEKLEG